MNRRNQPQSVTDLPASAHDDRRARMIKYTVAMSVRTVCVILLVFVRDWWIIVVAAGAIILPYIAVVVANVGARPATVAATRTGAVVPVRPVILDDERGEDPRPQ